MTFQSHSQAGQDQFVYGLFPPGHRGTFLDVGCCHPVEISNTYALEKVGWKGLLIDVDDVGQLCKEHRTSPFKRLDATKCDYEGILRDAGLPSLIDYLSLDVDAASWDALRNIPLNRLRFNVITIEHDRYRFGQPVADKMRRHLELHGYSIERMDVTHSGLPFEDWWTHKSFALKAR